MFCGAGLRSNLVIAAGGDGLERSGSRPMGLSEVARPVSGIVPLGDGMTLPPAAAFRLTRAGDGSLHEKDCSSGRRRKAKNIALLNAQYRVLPRNIIATTPPESNSALGPVAYTVMGAIWRRTFNPTKEVILPDRDVHRQRPVAIVGNGRQSGPAASGLRPGRALTTACSMFLPFQIFLRGLLAEARELQALSPDGEYVSYWQVPRAEVQTDKASSQPRWGASAFFKRPASSSVAAITHSSAELSIVIGGNRRKAFGDILNRIRSKACQLGCLPDIQPTE